jgi:hypothetical protein
MIDDELRALVSVNAPAGLNARVRARVASDGEVRRRRLIPSLMLAAAAVTVVAVGTVLWTTAARDSRPAAALAPLEARAVTHDVWPALHHPALSAPPPLPAGRREGGLIQVDPRETQALRALFASASAFPPAVPEPKTGPILVPEIAIEPIAAPNSEGARP